MCDVSPSQQASILSYISHLVGRDFAAVPADLAAMGFVPPDKQAALRDSGVVSVLSEVFRALAKGGGAKNVAADLRATPGRVDALARDIADVQARYGNILASACVLPSFPPFVFHFQTFQTFRLLSPY